MLEPFDQSNLIDCQVKVITNLLHHVSYLVSKLAKSILDALKSILKDSE